MRRNVRPPAARAAAGGWRSDVLAQTATCPCQPSARMARGRPKLLLGVLLGPCVWLAPTGAQLITQCTDINVGAAYLSEHRAFGGPEFCCTEVKPGDGSAPVLCCPGDGREYDINDYCPKDKVELRPSAEPDRADFLWENRCPDCLGDGSCSGTLQLDGINTQGPQVRAQSSHARQPTRPEWPTSRMAPDPNGPSAPSGLRAARHASVRSCPRLAAFDGAQERVGVRAHLPDKVRQE